MHLVITERQLRDIVRRRFPNQEITKKNGGFAKIKTFPKNGFVYARISSSGTCLSPSMVIDLISKLLPRVLQ